MLQDSTHGKQILNALLTKGRRGYRYLLHLPFVKVEMEKIDPKTQKSVIDSSGKPVTELVEITKPAFKPVYVFYIIILVKLPENRCRKLRQS